MAENIVGWCAVVLPSENEFQGYFIEKTEKAVADGRKLRLGLLAALGARPAVLGALEAAMIEGAVTHNGAVLSAAALEIMSLTGERNFAIIATRMEEGISTRMEPLSGATSDEAREAFNALPEVVAIKQRIAAGAPKVKH